MARDLSWATIHRLWQMLLKGLKDVEVAPEPREAAEMVLLRLIHAADLPDPAALMAKLGSEDAGAPARSNPQGKGPGSPAQFPRDFGALVRTVESSGKHLIAQQLHDQVSLVRYAPPDLVLKPLRPLGSDWSRDLAAALKSATGSMWRVSLSSEPGEPSLLDQEKIAEERVRADVLSDPNVQTVMDAFPGSELESFTSRGA
jgi:DNA polymerase-3 subunit gamma/tau